MPETNTPIVGAQPQVELPDARHAGVGQLLAPGGGSGSPRRRTPASSTHLGRALADDLVARLAKLERRREISAPLARLLVIASVAGRGRAEIVAAGELGVVETEPDVDREAGGRGEADAAAAARPCRRRRGRVSWAISSREPVKRPSSGEVGDPRAVGLVDVGEVVGADHAGELRVLDPAGEVGGDADRAGELLAGRFRRSDRARRPGRCSGCRRRAARRAGAFVQVPAPAPSGWSRAWIRPMTAPPRRITAASWPPSGRKLPARAMSTGAERTAIPVRVKLAMLSRASARGKAAAAGLGEIEAAGGLAAEAEAGREGVEDRQVEAVEPRLDDQAVAIAAGEPDAALRQHERQPARAASRRRPGGSRPAGRSGTGCC